MASAVKRPGGRFWISFRNSGKHYTVRLGKTTRTDAEDFRRRLERLVEYAHLGIPAPAEVVAWADRLGGGPRHTLELAGLLGHRAPRTVGELVAARLEAAAGRSDRTRVNYAVLGRSLVDHFGADRLASSITATEATAYRAALFARGGACGGPLAEATVSHRVRWARYLFAGIEPNPFSNVCGLSECNPARDVYVPREVIEAAIAATEDLEARAVFALARYAGLRVPSELTELDWRLYAGGRLAVHAPKLAYRGAAAWREVPVAPEAAARLDALRAASGGVGAIFPRLGHRTCTALSNRLGAALRRRGLPLWPKPWVNLRASCERDMLAEHPIDVVTAWLGHSPEIALRHYNRARQATAFEAAPACAR